MEHIVFLMMENRSYDHYFGDYPRGRGFDDHPAKSLGVFAQDYPDGGSLVPPNKLLPFHLDNTAGMECTDDLTHDWGPMHLCWNGGKMDSWVKVHTSSQYEGAHGAMTMGYYERADLAFYYRRLVRRQESMRVFCQMSSSADAPSRLVLKRASLGPCAISLLPGSRTGRWSRSRPARRRRRTGERWGRRR